jgi:hypothetical protein
MIRRQTLITVPPEQTRILQSLITPATIAGAVLGISESCINAFLTKTADFVRKHHKQLDVKYYCLILDTSAPINPPLDCSTVLANVNKEKAVFYVDEELRLTKVISCIVRNKDCQDITEKESKLGILVSGTYVWLYLNGRLIEEMDVLQQRNGPPVLSRFARPVSELEHLLTDHMEHCIAREQRVQYWQNRTQRTLLSGPNGTEEIFRQSLFVWLNDNVSDKLRVYADTTGVGQDKTDVMIVTINGTHMVEVKWLGKNEKGTSYSEPRIDEGLVQVSIYLNNDEAIIVGYLVIYDGRSIEDHKAKSRWTASLKHKRCTLPRILFLETEPPSQAAVRIVRNRAR